MQYSLPIGISGTICLIHALRYLAISIDFTLAMLKIGGVHNWPVIAIGLNLTADYVHVQLCARFSGVFLLRLRKV